MYVENLKKVLKVYKINPPPLDKLGAPPSKRRSQSQYNFFSEIYFSRLFASFEIHLQKSYSSLPISPMCERSRLIRD